MIAQQNTKAAIIVAPVSADTNGVTGTLDTLNAAYAEVRFISGVIAASSIPTVLKIEQGDTTNTWSAITGAVVTTDYTIPTPSTADGKVVRFLFPCGGPIKRYIKASFTPAAAHVVSIDATLSRLKQTPNTDAEFGADDVVVVVA